MINFKKIIQGLDLDQQKYQAFLILDEPKYYPLEKRIEITFTVDDLPLFKDYYNLKKAFEQKLGISVFFKFNISNPINNSQINGYLADFCARSLNKLKNQNAIIENDHIVYYLNFSITPEEVKILTNFLNSIGVYYPLKFILVDDLNEPIRDKVVLKQGKIKIKEAVAEKKYNQKKKYHAIKLIDADDYLAQHLGEANILVEIEANVASIDYRSTSKGKHMYKLILEENDDSLLATFYSDKLEESLQKKKRYLFRGRLKDSDKYNEEVYLFIDSFQVVELKEEKVIDSYEQKRVEFLVRTKMSEMDGISDVQEYIQKAIEMGHKALCISDFNSVQAFPKAQMAAKKLDPDFKVIYGLSLSVVEDKLEIVINPKDQNLSDASFCFMDFETTGLSAYYDHLIEFGGEKYYGGKSEKTQFFIKAPISVPSFIVEKTKIDDFILQNQGIDIEDALDRIVEFIGDSIIVAHNARFDFDFLNECLKRHNRPILTNPVIDTLNFSRSLHFNKHRHNLGTIAKHYGIEYNEDVAHRADYDTEVLKNVFFMMLRESKINKLTDLANFQPQQAHAKLFDNYVNIIAKNAQGLKDLFEIVSLAHTKYLCQKTKTVAGPKIIFSEIEKRRENLIISSGNYYSNLMETAMNKGDDQLTEVIKFYDVIEIQDLDAYNYLIHNNRIDVPHLIDCIRRIIRIAESMGKMVIASGDVYFAHPQQKIIRDIYINSKAIGGIRHPLFIYDLKRRSSFKAPDAYFKSTDQMMEVFSYLSKEQKLKYIIENTNKLAEMIECIYPVKSKLFPPKMENSSQKLKEICYGNAYQKYGNPLPLVVEQRLSYELDNIITHEFDVIYYISHLIVAKSLNDGYLVGSRGSVGSSFTATMANITEVNPLKAHYYCLNCHYFSFDDSAASGFDLVDKNCPNCGQLLKSDGQDIPFETFLGFNADKVPDIDLNFSGVYQATAHEYTKELFGVENVYRAGTVSTVASKTAYGYVKAYEEENGLEFKTSKTNLLAEKAEGVKRTTGQHPGGIIVIPSDMSVYDFTPIQYPANDASSAWCTTHFEFGDIHDNLLKLDLLGHVDPTAIKFLTDLSGIDPKTIKMNDSKVISIFSSVKELNFVIADERDEKSTGALGLPEFGTSFVRRMLEVTRPSSFDELVRISGLSHGTDVWNGNAEELITNQNLSLKDVIACRDDIMTYLIGKNLEPKLAFDIMESVRKGKGLKAEWEEVLKQHQVPNWYIESCKKIKYMFPKAHAVAYVLMAYRIAYYKVYYPLYYYAMYFSVRCDTFDIEAMQQGYEAVKMAMDLIEAKVKNKENTVKDNAIYHSLESALEMIRRGYKFTNIDIHKSAASKFIIDENNKALIPPFTALDGLGEAVANSIVSARDHQAFISIEDIKERTSLNKTIIETMKKMNIIHDLSDENQLSFF